MIPKTTENNKYSQLSFKRYANKCELLYVSDTIVNRREIARVDDIEEFFPALFPNALERIFQALKQHKRIQTIIFLEGESCAEVLIEGHVLPQPSENSYIVNAVIIFMPSENKYTYLLDETTGKIHPSVHHLADSTKNIEDLALYIHEQFPSISQKEFIDFVKGDGPKSLEFDQGKIYMEKSILGFPSYTQISLEKRKKEGPSLPLLDWKVEETVKMSPSSVFVKYGSSEKDIHCFGAVEKLLGYSNAEFSKIALSGFEDLLHPEDLSSMAPKLVGLDKSEIPIYSYFRMRHKDGHFIYVQETTRFFFDPVSGEEVYLKSLEDISHIEEFTADFLSEKGRLVPNLMPCLMYLFERNQSGGHKIVFVNEGVKELIGLNSEEFLERYYSFDTFIHPDDLARIKKKGKAAFLSNSSVEHYFRIHTVEGKQKWVYATSSPLKKSENKDIWAGYMLDISFAKEVEDTNQKHIKQLKSIYDNSPLAIINFDRDGVILSVNKTLLKKIALDDPKELVGKNIRSFSSDEGIVTAFMDAFRHGRGEYEGPYVTSLNRKHFYVRLTVEKMEHVDGYQALFEDITEQEYTQLIMNNVAEISARYSDKQFFNELVKLLTKKLDMDMCIIGEYLPNQDAVESISIAQKGKIMPNISYRLENTPCEKALAQGQNGLVIHCDNVIENFPLDEMLQEMGARSYCSTGIKDKSGAKIGILVLLDTKPIRNPKGIRDIITVLGDRVGADLQRIRNEKNLIESRQLYKSIAENFPKGTVDVLDRKFRYVYTEGSEYRNMQMDPHGLIGTFHLAKYDALTAAKAKKKLDRVFEGETVFYEIFYNEQHYKKIGVPLSSDDGQIERILIVTQNITDAKKSEAEREKLIKDLSNHNDELQRFAYIVSHNLRAPIVNITSLLELFDEDDLDNPDNKEVIDNLKTSVSILNTTLTDLIEVVSIRKQKIVKVEQVYFHNVVNNIEKSLFKQLEEAKVKINRDFKVEAVNYVYSHIENFLLNFMTNSIKYSHPERTPEVWIKTAMEGDDCVLVFKDNGIGIDLEKYKDRIFGLYQRFHSHVEGKGLGLYLVREQIRSLDGDIMIESEVDKGTCFKVIMKNLGLTSNKSNYEDNHQLA